MKDAIVRWIQILVVFIVFMFILQTYIVNKLYRKNLMIAMIQTNSSIDKITMLMRSNTSGDEIEIIMKNKSVLDAKVLTHTRMRNQTESNVKESILPRKETIVRKGSSLTNKGNVTQMDNNQTVTSKRYNTRKNITMTFNGTTVRKPICSRSISKQPGRIRLTLTPEKNHIKEDTDWLKNELSKGGIYQPPSCKSKERVAIIIPFRDREEHLKIFLRHMHPFLQRQKLEYGIYVIELDKNITFNRAILMNIGFVEAMKLHSYTCFVFHDVDLLPEDDRIPYSCADNPQHLSVAVDTLNYTLPTVKQFGGVSAVRTEQFLKVNGMSNMFFGWGGEDDDLSERVRTSKYNISRPSGDIARYTMIGHVKDHDRNPFRRCLLKSVKERMDKDGLVNLKYDLVKLELRPLYTWMLVRVNKVQQLRSDSYLFQFYKDCVKEVQNNSAFLRQLVLPLVIVSLLCYIVSKS
ncbi:beta-1,4-galactosyltransferase 4-like [Ruditapes philippinarum]|uniref:beta-1,4-galactosyltransferase 4-like n=1 Tax=Ruditapes philippinarum TaxID=129788 RepID=UPI00295BE58A|nr:beta-1,4-galactosyltransferase 4-like [Ruditapes philippinarum]